jgi:hypothetical protein
MSAYITPLKTKICTKSVGTFDFYATGKTSLPCFADQPINDVQRKKFSVLRIIWEEHLRTQYKQNAQSLNVFVVAQIVVTDF